jgi:tetratricopeptide (TPR) repeat protein
MTARPIIFISAVSKELRSARQLVANTLHLLGYEPDWQDLFGTEQGDLRGMLRRKIDASAGVVQLVGQCYGAEPRTPDEQFGRVSYTQYEAFYAKQRGKKVWYLILEPNFTADPCDAEPEELRALQDAYRQQVKQAEQLYHPLGSSDALEATVLKLRDDLGKLRQRGKQWAIGVLALLVVIAALVIWLVHSGSKTREQLGETTQTVNELKSEMQKLREGIAQYPQAAAKAREAEGGQKKEEVEDRTYEELAKNLGVDAKTLKEKLPQFAEQLKSSPEATTYEKATSAYIAKDYAEAERLGLKAAGEAQEKDPPRIADAINALELAGWSAESEIEYARALDHFRAAARLTDRQRDPLEWVRLQFEIASTLDEDGRYSEAETILRILLNLNTEMLGPEHEFTLATRLTLAVALDRDGKYAEAADEDRALIKIEEELHGPNYSDALTLHNNLGLALYGQGKFAEAEREERYAFENEERVIGPTNRVTLFSHNNLAMALDAEGKHAEAEKEFRLVLKQKEQAPELGPENPYTLYTDYYLAVCLQRQGKIEEAKQFAKRAADGTRKHLGPDHPDTKKYQKLWQELSGSTRTGSTR